MQRILRLSTSTYGGCRWASPWSSLPRIFSGLVQPAAAVIGGGTTTVGVSDGGSGGGGGGPSGGPSGNGGGGSGGGSGCSYQLLPPADQASLGPGGPTAGAWYIYSCPGQDVISTDGGIVWFADQAAPT